MIVETMTHEEVYQELERDRASISRWWSYKLEAQRRRAMKCQQFPLKLSFDYTSTRKNKYIFMTWIFDKRMKAIMTGIATLRHTSEGWSVYTNWLGHQRLICPMVILPHVFKRYAERLNIQKNGVELIRHYFTNNSHGRDSHNQKVVGKSVRHNGEEHIAYCVTDGVLLGQMQSGLFVARTFITYDMCSGLQQREFESCRKQVLPDVELHERAKAYYNR